MILREIRDNEIELLKEKGYKQASLAVQKANYAARNCFCTDE